MKTRTLAALTAAIAVAAPAAAQAHVTIQPPEAAAGGYARLDVRVPNEQDDAGTTAVAVKMPDGVVSASYEPRPGWTVKVTKKRLATPVEVHGEPIDEQIDTVTFTGKGEDGIIGPGQFVDFGLSVRVPDGKAGDKLAFPATQTYENGDVVRWIGPEDAEKPAPTLTLTAAADEHGGTGAGAAAEDASAHENASAATPVSAAALDGKASDGLALAGIILGTVGILAGIAGVLIARRPRLTA